MSKDYITIQETENGWLITRNEYASDVGRRGRWVAESEERLYEILHTLIPVKEVTLTES